MARTSRLHDRFLKSTEKQRQALSLRLRRDLGWRQLEELVRGTQSEEESWSLWCHEVLISHVDLHSLLTRLADGCSELGASLPAPLLRLGTQAESYWTLGQGDDAGERHLQFLGKINRLSLRQVAQIQSLRRARISRLCVLPLLVEDEFSETGRAIFTSLFQCGCPLEHEAACDLILTRSDGFNLLADYATQACLAALCPIAIAAQQVDSPETHRQVVKVIQASLKRLWELQEDRSVPCSEWLQTAQYLLTPQQTVGVALWYAIFIEDATTQEASWRILYANSDVVRKKVFPVLERWLGVEELLQQHQHLPTTVRADILEWATDKGRTIGTQRDWAARLVWTALNDAKRFPTPEELIQALWAIQSAKSARPKAAEHENERCLDLYHVLPNLMQIGSAFGDATFAGLWIRALDFSDAACYGIAFNTLIDLGPPARLAMERALGTESVHHRALLALMERLAEASDSLILEHLLQSDERRVRHEAYRQLSLRGDDSVLPLAQEFADSDDPEERALALFGFYHLAAAEGIEPAIRLLSDPYPILRKQARWVILRNSHPERLEKLVGAAREDSYLQRRGAIQLLGEIGGGEATDALARLTSTRQDLDPVIRMAMNRAQGGTTLDPDALPALRNPYFPQHPLPPNWDRYFSLVQDSPQLLKEFDTLVETGSAVTTDEAYQAIYRECIADATQNLWRFLHDVIIGQALHSAKALASYRETKFSESEISEALIRTLRKVSPAYLSGTWKRGRPEYVLGFAEAAQWMPAVIWELQENLLTRCPEVPLPSNDKKILGEWHLLQFYPSFYWDFLVRPRIPLEAFAAFVTRHFREVNARGDSPKGRAAAEIVDYLALQCTLHSGTARWREECRDALRRCVYPLWTRTSRQLSSSVHDKSADESLVHHSGQSQEELNEALLLHAFNHALEEFLPFWQPHRKDPETGEQRDSVPEAPLMPIGVLQFRSSTVRLPVGHHGRGVPFTHYLAERFQRLARGERPIDPYREEEQDSDEDGYEDQEIEDVRKKKWQGKPFVVAPGLPICRDRSGTEYVRIAHLPQYHQMRKRKGRTDVLWNQERLPEGFVWREIRRTWPHLIRTVKGSQVIPGDALPEIRRELIARYQLLRKNQLAEALKVSPRTLRHWESKVEDKTSSVAILEFLQDAAQRHRKKKRSRKTKSNEDSHAP